MSAPAERTDVRRDPDRLAQLEEERRLFYVGMTRAENKLYLTSARYRRYFGNTDQQASEPSRFLAEIPPELVDEVSERRRKPAAKRRWGYWALPILYDERLVGKLDATADRKEGVLLVDAVHEDEPFTKKMTAAVDAEIDDLARWLGLDVLTAG